MFPPSLLLVFILTLIAPSFSITSSSSPGYPSPYPDGWTGPYPEGYPDPYPDPYPGRYPGIPTSKLHPYLKWEPRTTSLSASPTSMANTTGPRTTASSTAPPQSTSAASHRGIGDPCGPLWNSTEPMANQTDFESTLNTCGAINTTYTDAPSEFGVQCINAYPSLHQKINVSSCESNIVDMCSRIHTGDAKVSQWNWSSGGPNCTVGVWFNPSPAAPARWPANSCRNDIFNLMSQTCFPTPEGPKGFFNVAAVNLRTLPDESSTGSQVDTGYASYIMVPQTYDNIYEHSVSGYGYPGEGGS